MDSPSFDLQEVKRVLEAALLTSPEPLQLVGPEEAVRRGARQRCAAQCARRTARGLGRAQRRARQCRERLALPRAARVSEVPRPPESAEAAALFARGDGNARDHRLPAAGHARRHRGHPRRHRVDQHHQGARRRAAGSTSSATAKCRAGRSSLRRRASFSTISACAR